MKNSETMPGAIKSMSNLDSLYDNRRHNRVIKRWNDIMTLNNRQSTYDELNLLIEKVLACRKVIIV